MKISVFASTKSKYFLPPSEALFMGGQFAGICYSKDGMDKILVEPQENTQARINQTLNSLHHSVYGHPHYSLELKSVPKILAMILNNENCYDTSEKSARFTEMAASPQESPIYEKWLEIFKTEVAADDPTLSASDVKKKAQENARYMISVFTPATDMIYTASFSQLNYIMYWCEKYIQECESNDFNDQLIPVLQMFLDRMNNLEKSITQDVLNSISILENTLNEVFLAVSETVTNHHQLEYLDENLKFTKGVIARYKEIVEKEGYRSEFLSLKVDGLNNEAKKIRLSLFDKRKFREEEWGENYSHTYQGTFSQLAQAQRHRTLKYHMRFLESPKFYIPILLRQNEELASMWLDDISSLVDNYPQGMIISINEHGHYEKFIQKCTERLCSKAQLEVSLQTMDTLDLYVRFTQHTNKEVYEELLVHQHACRMCFDGDASYPCSNPCQLGDSQLSRLY